MENKNVERIKEEIEELESVEISTQNVEKKDESVEKSVEKQAEISTSEILTVEKIAEKIEEYSLELDDIFDCDYMHLTEKESVDITEKALPVIAKYISDIQKHITPELALAWTVSCITIPRAWKYYVGERRNDTEIQRTEDDNNNIRE